MTQTASSSKYEWDWEGDGTYDYNAGTNPITTHAYPVHGIYIQN